MKARRKRAEAAEARVARLEAALEHARHYIWQRPTWDANEPERSNAILREIDRVQAEKL
jgi:hypothetical protein